MVIWVRGHYGQFLELPEWLRHEGQNSRDRKKSQRKSPMIYAQISLKLLTGSTILHEWSKSQGNPAENSRWRLKGKEKNLIGTWYWEAEISV